MGEIETWLAQMPREGVRKRIAQLERELEVLRRLEQIPVPESGAPDRLAASGPLISPAAAKTVTKPQKSRRRRRLSPERVAIIDVVRQHPEGMAPIEVAHALGKELNPVQTAMSRMAKAGQLDRMGHRRYTLPLEVSAATLLDSDAPKSTEGVDAP